MAERQFLEPSAKRRITACIRALEAGTSVEVVVAVRRRAERHLATSMVLGSGLAVVTLAILWFSPQVYDVRTMPLDALAAFALGVLLGGLLPGLRRVLTPRSILRAAAQRGARRAFGELGVEKTRDRVGLLIYVALFEREVVIIPDQGLPEALVEQGLAEVRRELAAAVRTLNFDAFEAAISKLGAPAAAHLPRRPDDENELCDDVA
jgi:putative membrane protein